MASTNKTPNYDLPQFIATDKPTWLGDINGAMLAIDTGMQENKVAADSASSAAQSAQGSATAAQQAAQNAAQSASDAVTAAQGAQTTATSAISTATSAATKADAASSAAATASSQAQSAQTTASQAATAAETAQTAAGAAATAANQAKTVAESAMDVANSVQDDVQNINAITQSPTQGTKIRLWYKKALQTIYFNSNAIIKDKQNNLLWKSGNYGYYALNITSNAASFWSGTPIQSFNISYDDVELPFTPSISNSFYFPCRAIPYASGDMGHSPIFNGFICKGTNNSIWILVEFTSGDIGTGDYFIVPTGPAITMAGS